jgi:aryl-alcohol dehydrogenase
VNTGAGAVLNVLEPQPGDSYVAFGTGTVGFAGLLAAKLRGCDPIVAVDLYSDRLALARELGATHTVDAHRADVVAAVKRLVGGRGARFCLEAAGAPRWTCWPRAGPPVSSGAPHPAWRSRWK